MTPASARLVSMLLETIVVGLFIAMLQLSSQLEDLLFFCNYDFLLAEIFTAVNTIFMQERR